MNKMTNWKTVALAILLSGLAAASAAEGWSDLTSATRKQEWKLLAADSAHFAADVYRSMSQMVPLVKPMTTRMFDMVSPSSTRTVADRKASGDAFSEAYSKFRTLASPLKTRFKDLVKRSFTLGARTFSQAVSRGTRKLLAEPSAVTPLQDKRQHNLHSLRERRQHHTENEERHHAKGFIFPNKSPQ